MKRIINSSGYREEVNLTDLFSLIDRIIVVDDARKYEDGKIYASSIIDYNEYSDDELMDLDVDEIHEIEDVSVMQRIYFLDSTKLSSMQKRLVKNEFGVKVIIDKKDVEIIIDDLKSCERIRVEDTPKNRKFDYDFNISDSDKLEIIHSLKMSDFVSITKSYTQGHEGNRLIVFMPEVDLETRDGVLGVDIYLYIKIDLSTLTDFGGVIAVVSFHLAENDNSLRPYHRHDPEIDDSDDSMKTW